MVLTVDRALRKMRYRDDLVVRRDGAHLSTHNPAGLPADVRINLVEDECAYVNQFWMLDKAGEDMTELYGTV